MIHSKLKYVEMRRTYELILRTTSSCKRMQKGQTCFGDFRATNHWSQSGLRILPGKGFHARPGCSFCPGQNADRFRTAAPEPRTSSKSLPHEICLRFLLQPGYIGFFLVFRYLFLAKWKPRSSTLSSHLLRRDDQIVVL